MYLTFEYDNKIEVMELDEFKHQEFYTEKNFPKVRIYDFAYISSQRQVREYRQKMLSIPKRLLKTFNL